MDQVACEHATVARYKAASIRSHCKSSRCTLPLCCQLVTNQWNIHLFEISATTVNRLDRIVQIGISVSEISRRHGAKWLSERWLKWWSNARISSEYLSVYGSGTDLFLAVLDPRVGLTMDVLSPSISVLCHSDWLFHGESCPRLDVVHPGCAWSSSPACTWHCSLHYLFLQATPLFPHDVTIVY